MHKALLSNKEKLQELATTPLNENCSAVILKKLPEKLKDPGKFLIPYGFSELKCKALADLANRAICTPSRIARYVFVPIGKFTFSANFVIVDYEIDPRVPLILGRHFLRTARALIDVHGEEMIKKSINLIIVFNNSSEDFLEDLFSTNQPSGNPTFLFHPELTLPKVQNDIFDPEGGNVLPEKMLDLDSTKILVSRIRLITNEHALDYSSPLIFDEYDDDFLEVESDTENFYDDPFDSKGEKIKESKLLMDELDLHCDFLPSSEYDSFTFEDFSRVNAKPSINNEDKDFDPPLYEPLLFKEVPRSNMLLLFSSENEEKVFKPRIHTSEKVHSSRISELSHQGYKFSKSIKFLKAR
nr:hypothetical protein [Tanacetum cinerariifolium]